MDLKDFNDKGVTAINSDTKFANESLAMSNQPSSKAGASEVIHNDAIPLECWKLLTALDNLDWDTVNVDEALALINKIPRVRGVCFDRKGLYWISQWHAKQRKHREWFAVKRLGFRKAWELAVCVRRDAEKVEEESTSYPSVPALQEALGVTYQRGDHGRCWVAYILEQDCSSNKEDPAVLKETSPQNCRIGVRYFSVSDCGFEEARERAVACTISHPLPKALFLTPTTEQGVSAEIIKQDFETPLSNEGETTLTCNVRFKYQNIFASMPSSGGISVCQLAQKKLDMLNSGVHPIIVAEKSQKRSYDSQKFSMRNLQKNTTEESQSSHVETRSSKVVATEQVGETRDIEQGQNNIQSSNTCSLKKRIVLSEASSLADNLRAMNRSEDSSSETYTLTASNRRMSMDSEQCSGTEDGFSHLTPEDEEFLKSPEFLNLPKIGGVYYKRDGNYKAWAASWHIKGKRVRRYFTVKKHGFKNAYLQAVRARKEAERQEGICVKQRQNTRQNNSSKLPTIENNQSQLKASYALYNQDLNISAAQKVNSPKSGDAAISTLNSSNSNSQAKGNLNMLQTPKAGDFPWDKSGDSSWCGASSGLTPSPLSTTKMAKLKHLAAKNSGNVADQKHVKSLVNSGLGENGILDIPLDVLQQQQDYSTNVFMDSEAQYHNSHNANPPTWMLTQFSNSAESNKPQNVGIKSPLGRAAKYLNVPVDTLEKILLENGCIQGKHYTEFYNAMEIVLARESLVFLLKNLHSRICQLSGLDTVSLENPNTPDIIITEQLDMLLQLYILSRCMALVKRADTIQSLTGLIFLFKPCIDGDLDPQEMPIPSVRHFLYHICHESLPWLPKDAFLPESLLTYISKQSLAYAYSHLGSCHLDADLKEISSGDRNLKELSEGLFHPTANSSSLITEESTNSTSIESPIESAESLHSTNLFANGLYEGNQKFEYCATRDFDGNIVINGFNASAEQALSCQADNNKNNDNNNNNNNTDSNSNHYNGSNRNNAIPSYGQLSSAFLLSTLQQQLLNNKQQESSIDLAPQKLSLFSNGLFADGKKKCSKNV